jgi:basic amino acid/polyamine antiporter, APA family
MANPLFERKPLALLLEEMKGENRLRRVLGPVTLTSLGVGAIIGAGIFVITGKAAHEIAGPALILSFVMSGIACIFSALCYAEFASMVPVAGSAYTYAYATLGEVFAWIIGWDLVLEYTVASSAVAHGWSQHAQDLLQSWGIYIPKVFSAAPFNYDSATEHIVKTGTYFDLPAILIAVFITCILVKGIRESAGLNAGMVLLKLTIVLFVIAVGVFFINPKNWLPFAPYGYTGISFFGHTLFGQTSTGGKPLGAIAGAAIIFFAYIGFDSVSTHAEEAKKPQRDVPIGIIASLIICTVLYIAVSAVITGMVPYDKINVNAPIANAFAQQGLPWAQRIIDIGAVVGIASVLLVLMLSQPRVLLAMARDGLLPHSFFGAVHEKFRTPWKSTILTGILVSCMAGLLPLDVLANLVNIGTLLAFVIVCGSVLVMRYSHPEAERPFRAPFVPLVPILGILTCLILMFSLPSENWWRLFVWLFIGFLIYFCYGRRHSVMAKMRAAERQRK